MRLHLIRPNKKCRPLPTCQLPTHLLDQIQIPHEPLGSHDNLCEGCCKLWHFWLGSSDETCFLSLPLLPLSGVPSTWPQNSDQHTSHCESKHHWMCHDEDKLPAKGLCCHHQLHRRRFRFTTLKSEMMPAAKDETRQSEADMEAGANDSSNPVPKMSRHCFDFFMEVPVNGISSAPMDMAR